MKSGDELDLEEYSPQVFPFFVSLCFSIVVPYPITVSSAGRDDGQSAIFGRGPSVTGQQGRGYVCVLYIPIGSMYGIYIYMLTFGVY